MRRSRSVAARVHVAIDCSLAIDPDSIRAQCEGSVARALRAALGPTRVTFTNDTAEQSNFHDYSVLTMAASPRTSTVMLEGDDRPSGVSEPAVPVIAPALANAFVAAVGARRRHLPLTDV